MRARSWWGRAWARAVDEAASDDDVRRRARGLVRTGAVGPVSVVAGDLRASVVHGAHTLLPVVSVPVWDEAAVGAFAEAVAADPTRLTGLLAGDLPHEVVEHAEEAGVELLPYGEEFTAVCPCASWRDRCVHAVAVLDAAARVVDADPLVLLALRGLPRDRLVARVRELTRPERAPTPEQEATLDLAAEAALRAAALLGCGHDVRMNGSGTESIIGSTSEEN